MELGSWESWNLRSCGQRLRSSWCVSCLFVLTLTCNVLQYVGSMVIIHINCVCSPSGTVQKQRCRQKWLCERLWDADGCWGCWWEVHFTKYVSTQPLSLATAKENTQYIYRGSVYFFCVHILRCLNGFVFRFFHYVLLDIILNVFLFSFRQVSLSTTLSIRSLWLATLNQTSALTLTTLCAAWSAWSHSSVSLSHCYHILSCDQHSAKTLQQHIHHFGCYLFF